MELSERSGLLSHAGGATDAHKGTAGGAGAGSGAGRGVKAGYGATDVSVAFGDAASRAAALAAVGSPVRHLLLP